MLALTRFLISNNGLLPLVLGWLLGAALIVIASLLNRRRIRSHDHQSM